MSCIFNLNATNHHKCSRRPSRSTRYRYRPFSNPTYLVRSTLYPRLYSSSWLTTIRSVPPNCTFEVDDAEDEWIYKTPFQYIHARAILSCFSTPKDVIQSAYDALAPGGYLEFQDPVIPMKWVTPPPPDCAFVKWNQLSVEASNAGGRAWNNVQHYSRWFSEVGFEDVHEETFFLANGPWPEGETDEAKVQRMVGIWQRENLLEGLEGMTVKNLARIGWEPEESKVLIAQVREELNAITPGSSYKPYNDVVSVWGRKPLGKGKDVMDESA